MFIRTPNWVCWPPLSSVSALAASRYLSKVQVVSVQSVAGQRHVLLLEQVDVVVDLLVAVVARDGVLLPVPAVELERLGQEVAQVEVVGLHQVVKLVEQVLLDGRRDRDDLLEVGEHVRRVAAGRLHQHLLHHLSAVGDELDVNLDARILGHELLTPLRGDLRVAGDAVHEDDLPGRGLGRRGRLGGCRCSCWRGCRGGRCCWRGAASRPRGLCWLGGRVAAGGRRHWPHAASRTAPPARPRPGGIVVARTMCLRSSSILSLPVRCPSSGRSRHPLTPLNTTP